MQEISKKFQKGNILISRIFPRPYAGYNSISAFTKVPDKTKVWKIRTHRKHSQKPTEGERVYFKENQVAKISIAIRKIVIRGRINQSKKNYKTSR